MLTIADIERLEELERKATEGPFALDKDRREGGSDQIVTAYGRGLTIAFGTSDGNEDDFWLLIALRNHAPSLLRLAREALAARERDDAGEPRGPFCSSECLGACRQCKAKDNYRKIRTANEAAEKGARDGAE